MLKKFVQRFDQRKPWTRVFTKREAWGTLLLFFWVGSAISVTMVTLS